jgi:phosphoribosylamine-glycine ligase
VKVSILGGGGREQASAWTANKVGDEVYVVAGDAGIPWLRRERVVLALRWYGVAFVAAGIFRFPRTRPGG